MPTDTALQAPTLLHRPCHWQLVYQPQFHARDGRWCGVEALLRGHSPAGALLPLAQVLAAAAAQGPATDLSRWVLERALADSRHWHAQAPDIRLAVNLPPSTLVDPELAAWLLTRLHRSGYPARQLTLEITEHPLSEDAAASRRTVETLAQAGVRWSIDDFGCGHANLLRLLQLPCEQLKLDRHFVSRLGHQAGALPILYRTARLAHELGVELVIEGIETQFQFQQARRCGSQVLQGFLLSRPLPPTQLGTWAATWPQQQARLWPQSRASTAKAAVSVRSTRRPSPTG